MCTQAACVGCNSSVGLRKLTPTNFICEDCQGAMGLEPAAQFANEGEWLQEVLAEVADALTELSTSSWLSDHDKSYLKRAQVFTAHARNRFAESLVLVSGA